MHDQAAAGAIARPPYEITRVRRQATTGFCNVLRETNAARLSRRVLVPVSIVATHKGDGRYRSLGADAAETLRAVREEGRIVWGISAKWTDEPGGSSDTCENRPNSPFRALS